MNESLASHLLQRNRLINLLLIKTLSGVIFLDNFFDHILNKILNDDFNFSNLMQGDEYF